MRATRSLLLALLAASIAACGDDDDTGANPSPSVARLRLVNAAAGTSSVDMLLSGSDTPLATLDFGQSNLTCVEVPAGTAQTLTFRSGSTTLATVTATFGKDERWTVFLTAAGETRRAVAVADEETAALATNGLRFVNATSSSGDVYATTPGGAPDPSTLARGNLSPTAASDDPLTYNFRPVGDTRVRLFDVGTTTGTPRADITLEGLPSSRLATVVFTEGATPETSAFVVFPCQ